CKNSDFEYQVLLICMFRTCLQSFIFLTRPEICFLYTALSYYPFTENCNATKTAMKSHQTNWGYYLWNPRRASKNFITENKNKTKKIKKNVKIYHMQKKIRFRQFLKYFLFKYSKCLFNLKII